MPHDMCSGDFNGLSRPFLLRGGSDGVLLIHGFTASAAQMHPLAEMLHEKGMTVKAILLPGHGTTREDMRAHSREEWESASLDALRSLEDLCGQPAHVCGLSMGGVLSLRLAQVHAVRSCVTLSAPMGVKNALARYAGPLSRLVPYIHKRPDKRRRMLNAEYDQAYTSFPTCRTDDLLRLIADTRAMLSRVSCPILTVQSDADETIRGESMDVIQQGVSSHVKQTLWIHGQPHALVLTTALPQIAEAMLSFYASLSST